MKIETKMVNTKGNFTAKYYNYYADRRISTAKTEHMLFMNMENCDAINVCISEDGKELIVMCPLHVSELDPRELDWFKLEAKRAGFRNAEYSQHFSKDVTRFPYTDSGLDDAGEYIRVEAKKRGMVQNNGWPFKMAF